MTTFTLYVVALIPFAAYITPVFNVIVLTHTLFKKRVEIEAHHEKTVTADNGSKSIDGQHTDLLSS
ncbi:MAG TPA: hypothetical protein ENL04_04045 [Sulfuricurvum sp.]|nr:hypothetical protein [Sulfuricurvum sp.]